MAKGIFHRTELLFGSEKMNKLAEIKVIIFGIGGVGSWCAESLIRSGICNLTIVDSDKISVSNINRQLQATSKTIGQEKTEALKNRLLEINPAANITTVQKIYDKINHQEFELESYHFIIDSIDRLINKAHLIKTATQTKAVFISSMGAALKLDPTLIKVGSFWEVKGCHMARMLRKKLRKNETPIPNFTCVYSNELLENLNLEIPKPPSIIKLDQINSQSHKLPSKKALTNGSFAHTTAIYGFTIAGLIMKNIYDTHN
ncbi:MAG: tRNA threonylcarbamoyladenosine dehydratase [Salinivirgaceae bacterium]|nr:tRNA threonylcarbamoyladenosine dehydratase [Salinivirgaceae bacterium]